MKRFLLVLILVLNASVALSQQTLFLDKRYDQTLAKSKADRKPMVLFFYANWCPHCNKMKREVFTDSTVTALYRNKYVCMGIDATTPYGNELKAKFKDKFKVTSFPTFAYLDSNENLLFCISAELTKERFLSTGNETLLPESQLQTIKEAFESDPANPDKCLKYINFFKRTGLDATPIVQKYFKAVSPENKISGINWRILYSGLSNFDTEEFRFVVQNKEGFSKVADPLRVENKIISTITETFQPLIEKVDTINYDKKRILAESLKINKVDSLLYRFDIQIVSQTNNWKKYQKITTDNVEKYSWNDAVLLYDICTTYYEMINDKKGLQQAVEWSRHLISLPGTNIDRYVITSKLLMKLKDYKQALEVAQKGKDYVDGYGFNATEINALIADIKKNTL